MSDPAKNEEHEEIEPKADAEASSSEGNGDEELEILDLEEEGPASPAEAEPAPPPAESATGDEVERARREAAEAQEKLLRKEAELQNLHRRMQRELERSRHFGLRDLLQKLLPSLDNLERSLSVEDGQFEALKSGVQLVDTEIKRVLQGLGVEILDPVGETLDPNRHEAFLRQPHEEAEENTILSVFEKGYCLEDIVIRPARVIVASGEKPEPPTSPDDAAPDPQE